MYPSWVNVWTLTPEYEYFQSVSTMAYWRMSKDAFMIQVAWLPEAEDLLSHAN